MDLHYVIPKILRKILNPSAINKSKIDRTAKADIGSVVNHSTLGRYSYIGEHSFVLYANVGSYTSISNYCAIGGGSHPTDWVSMSPVFNTSTGLMKASFAKNEYNPFEITTIGNDVWIGAHVMIKGGVSIADGAVVGMGSVVTHNIGPYEIWAGNPARFIRKRFDDETISKIKATNWWNWEEDKLKKYGAYFDNPVEFFSNVEVES